MQKGAYHIPPTHVPTAVSYLISLLNRGLCCVNINYRLGIFGFLAHPELSQEDRESMSRGIAAGTE